MATAAPFCKRIRLRITFVSCERRYRRRDARTGRAAIRESARAVLPLRRLGEPRQEMQDARDVACRVADANASARVLVAIAEHLKTRARVFAVDSGLRRGVDASIT